MPTALTPVFRADRLKADMRARDLDVAGLVKLIMAHEHPELEYHYSAKAYMKVWQRVTRFLGGKSSLDTAQMLAATLGYATSRYVTLSALAKRHKITA